MACASGYWSSDAGARTVGGSDRANTRGVGGGAGAGQPGAHDGLPTIAPSGGDPATGEDVLADAVRVARRCLGGRLLAAYALGSLAHGGFSALVSDIDLALVLADPIQAADAGTLLAVAADVRAVGSPLHARLSVFWGTPGSLASGAGGRFPPLDRLCLLEHGRLLIGADVRMGLPRPDRSELLVAGAEFALDALADHVIDRPRARTSCSPWASAHGHIP
jgi:hypothetical protein